MMNLKTGNLVNTERKFIIVPSKVDARAGEDWQNVHIFSPKKETLVIDQFYIDDVKYRCLVDPDKESELMDIEALRHDDQWGNEYTGYTKNIKKGNITEVTRITEKEYREALARAGNIVMSKTRNSVIFKQDSEHEYNIDTDIYYAHNLFPNIIEVSGYELDKYVPPPYFKEVTGDPMFSAKEMYKSFRETVRRQMEEMP